MVDCDPTPTESQRENVARAIYDRARFRAFESHEVWSVWDDLVGEAEEILDEYRDLADTALRALSVAHPARPESGSLAEYRDAVAKNRSAWIWDRADYLNDMDEWIAAHTVPPVMDEVAVRAEAIAAAERTIPSTGQESLAVSSMKERERRFYARGYTAGYETAVAHSGGAS